MPKCRLRLIFFFLITFMPVTHAAEDPLTTLSAATGVPIKGPWDAAGSIAAIQKMYQTMVVQLQELKTQSQFLSDVNKVAKESLRQYDAINNSSLASVIKRIKEDGEAITMLNSMGGMSERQKLETLSKELDRRISDPKTSQKERENLTSELSIILALKRLEGLEDAANRNMEKTSGPIDAREGEQITSQSIAILTKLQILESKHRYKTFMAGVKGNQIRKDMSQPSAIMESIGSHQMDSTQPKVSSNE